jgi:hypothetical protein
MKERTISPCCQPGISVAAILAFFLIASPGRILAAVDSGGNPRQGRPVQPGGTPSNPKDSFVNKCKGRDLQYR